MNETREKDQYQQILAALVTEKHRSLYLNSGDFNANVNSLVSILPAWVDFLAERATKKDGERAIELQRLMMQGLPPFGLT